ncbi:MAG: hypothetical protein LRY40_08310 [Shewanella fodinae]|nr:hypothetical protein [Shewanella fodinae]
MLVDDYGHHPSEVAATIRAARAGWPDERLVMVFQPHRYTRTRDLYEDFVDVLSQVDCLLMLEVYPAGETRLPGWIAGRCAAASVCVGRSIQSMWQRLNSYRKFCSPWLKTVIYC